MQNRNVYEMLRARETGQLPRGLLPLAAAQLQEQPAMQPVAAPVAGAVHYARGRGGGRGQARGRGRARGLNFDDDEPFVPALQPVPQEIDALNILADQLADYLDED